MKFDLGPIQRRLAQRAATTADARARELESIENALNRLEDGDFGYCGTCGERIEMARLCDDPTVETCKKCG